jgi:hypothetical protein
MRIYNPGGYQITASISTQPNAWNQIPASAFTATPASTSTITMGVDYTSILSVGMPVKYKISSTYYYGILTGVATNLLTIAGASMGADLVELWYGYTYRTEQLDIAVNGYYETADDHTVILNQLNSSLIWNKGTAYAVLMKVWSKTHDTGAHGLAQVLINGAELCSTSNGLTIAADATWYSTVVDITTANYDINYGEAIELTAHKGGNGDAHDLMVSIVFVHP